MLNLVNIRTKREALEESALQLATASPNCDPLDLIVARESAAERLAEYLRHIELHRAVNVVETVFSIRGRTLGRVS